MKKRPDHPCIEATVESEKEAKLIKEILAATTAKDSIYDTFLKKHKLQETSRASAWISRFINNCRKTRRTGPLRNEEIEKQLTFYIKRAQTNVEKSEKFKEDKRKLNICMNQQGIYVYLPAYLPSSSILS